MGADVDENVARLQPRDDELDQRALVVGTAVLGSHLLECHRTWIRGGEADGPAAWRHGAPGLAGGIARAALAEQSAELHQPGHEMPRPDGPRDGRGPAQRPCDQADLLTPIGRPGAGYQCRRIGRRLDRPPSRLPLRTVDLHRARSEEHTSELQSLMRISYAVFCLKKKQTHKYTYT